MKIWTLVFRCTSIRIEGNGEVYMYIYICIYIYIVILRWDWWTSSELCLHYPIPCARSRMKKCWSSSWSACGTAWSASRPWSCATLPGASPRWRKLREGCRWRGLRGGTESDGVAGVLRHLLPWILYSTMFFSFQLPFSPWIYQVDSDIPDYTRTYWYIYSTL